MTQTPERYALAPGFTVSRVLTGLWQVADLERDGRPLAAEGAADALLPYATAGYTTFDMADHYGSAEDIVGHFRARSAAPAVELLTKWVPEPGPITPEQVRTAVDRARRRMQVPSIDLLQFHAWAYSHPSWLDAMFYLDELRQEGLIRHLGETNSDTAHLRVLVESGIPIVSNQVCYSLLDQRAAGAMSEYCRSRGIAILAFGTLAGGFLSDRWLNQPEPDWDALETWSQMKYGRFIRAAGGWDALQHVLRVARQIADTHAVSIANVAGRAILDAPAVGGVIVGARLGQRTHIDDNARMNALRLDDTDRRQLADALQSLTAIPGDCGAPATWRIQFGRRRDHRFCPGVLLSWDPPAGGYRNPQPGVLRPRRYAYARGPRGDGGCLELLPQCGLVAALRTARAGVRGVRVLLAGVGHALRLLSATNGGERRG